MTGVFCLIRLGRSTKKYLRTNIPWRPRIEPPQLKHLTSRSGIGWGGTSMRTISYFAPQLEQSNGTDCESDINATLRIADHRLSKRIDGRIRTREPRNGTAKTRRRLLKVLAWDCAAGCQTRWEIAQTCAVQTT